MTKQLFSLSSVKKVEDFFNFCGLFKEAGLNIPIFFDKKKATAKYRTNLWKILIRKAAKVSYREIMDKLFESSKKKL